MSELSEIELDLDELEAVRLADLEGLYQADVAQQMGVSRQTVGNILTRAHRKIADALLNGKALRIAQGAAQSAAGVPQALAVSQQFSPSSLSITQDTKEPS